MIITSCLITIYNIFHLIFLEALAQQVVHLPTAQAYALRQWSSGGPEDRDDMWSGDGQMVKGNQR